LIGDTGGATSYVAPQAERALGQTAGRYVVIWITSVVETDDGANRAEISDVRILGSR
jgi:hypothetical protein